MAVSCGKKGVPSGEDNPFSTLEIIAGNDQVGAAGAFLADSLAVRVVNSVGLPVAGDTVRFSQISQDDGGEIIFEKRVTDADGNTFTRYRLDTLVGVDTIMAISDAVGDTGQVYFEMTVQAGPAGALIKVSPDTLVSGIAGQAISETFVVRVTDIYGNLVSGHQVNFRASSRNVVITDFSTQDPPETDTAYTVTDSNGLASATWIIAVDPGFGYPAFHQLTAYADYDITSDTVDFAGVAQDPGTLEYYYDIRPLFADNCFSCHTTPGDYRLDYYYEMNSGGNLIPGDTNSVIVRKTRYFDHLGHTNMVEEDKVKRWVGVDNGAPGSSGLNNYNDHIKSIIDAACIGCHDDMAPANNYSMTNHLNIRGGGADAISNGIPGADSSLLVVKMQERHNWSSLDPDSVTAAILADSIITWIVDDSLRQY
jgi:hypothetical protein